MTEVGWIPKDWEVSTIGDECDVKTGPFGSALHADDYVIKGTPIITVEHIGNVHIDKSRPIPQVSDEDKQRLKAYILKEGDIVFSRVGSIDRNSLVFKEEDGWLFSGRLLRMRKLSKAKFDPLYLCYHLNTYDSKNRILAEAVGQTMPSLNTKILNGISIVLPQSPSEQRRIAQVLSDTDSLIASLSRTIEKKRLVKQGAMQQLLTGKTRLKGFSGEWVEKELGECADIYRGGSPRPIEAFMTTLPEGLNWIKIGDVANNAKYINKTAEKIIPEGERHSRFVRNGDLLLSNSMSFGRPYILRTDGCIHDGWLVIQNYKDEWYTDFLYYLLCSENVLEQYEVLAAGSGVKNLNKAIVSNVILRYPVDLNEQFAIANILTTMDNEIVSLETELQKYKALKQGMMQKLLTGQIRLK